MQKLSLQKQYSPKGVCYGCGPANAKGIHLESYPAGDTVIAHWTPRPEHLAYPGGLNGGVIGTILDCHCNWSAAYFLMKRDEAEAPPFTVTADYRIKLKKPTPLDGELELIARAIALDGKKAHVEADLLADGVITAQCEGLFVAVGPDHPAFYRWQ